MTAFTSYAAYVSVLGETAAIQNAADDPDFVAILPAVIDYAEQRIYREIDFLSTTSVDDTLNLATGNRSLIYTSNTPFVTLQSVSIYTTRSKVFLEPVGREILDAVFGASTQQAMPTWFAVIDGKTLNVGPYPDQAYSVEVVGTIRPAPLSSTNETTFLTLNLPDLFLAASMIFVAGYQKNFGAQSDNPQSAMSWEQQYETLKASAMMEEARKKFASSGWSAYSAPTAATPTR